MNINSFLVASVFVNTGIGKESGNPFEMQRVGVLTSREDVDTKTFQSHGVGLSVVELSVSPNFFTALHNQFLKDFQGLPLLYSLETSLDREGRNRVVGFGKAPELPKPDAAPTTATDTTARPLVGGKPS